MKTDLLLLLPTNRSQTIAISTPLCSGLPSASQWEVWSERGGNCSEFVGNWKHLYPPVSPSLPALKTSTPPSSSLVSTFLYQHSVNGTPSPSCPPSPTGLNWCKWLCAHLLSRAEVTHLCGLLTVSHPELSQLQVLMPRHCLPPTQGVEWFVGKLGDPSGVWWLLLIHTRLSSSHLPCAMSYKLFREWLYLQRWWLLCGFILFYG